MQHGNAPNQMTLIAALPEGACLTVEELTGLVALERKVLVKTAGALVTRGLLERVERGCFQLTPEGVAVKDGKVPLKSGPRGPHTGRRKGVRNTLRVRLWRAARAAGKFTVPDLLMLAAKGSEKSAAGNAQRYLRHLEQAGYLFRLRAKAPGTALTSNGFTRWQLIRDTGPEAPILRQTAEGWEMYDPNTREVHPCAER